MKERAAAIEDSMNEMAAEAAETLRGAKKRVAEAYDSGAETATHWAQGAVQYGRDNPLLTSLLVFGAGLGLGCLLSYERRPRNPKRWVPAMAGAVAHAVREAIDARR